MNESDRQKLRNDVTSAEKREVLLIKIPQKLKHGNLIPFSGEYDKRFVNDLLMPEDDNNTNLYSVFEKYLTEIGLTEVADRNLFRELLTTIANPVVNGKPQEFEEQMTMGDLGMILKDQDYLYTKTIDGWNRIPELTLVIIKIFSNYQMESQDPQ